LEDRVSERQYEFRVLGRLSEETRQALVDMDVTGDGDDHQHRRRRRRRDTRGPRVDPVPRAQRHLSRAGLDHVIRPAPRCVQRRFEQRSPRAHHASGPRGGGGPFRSSNSRLCVPTDSTTGQRHSRGERPGLRRGARCPRARSVPRCWRRGTRGQLPFVGQRRSGPSLSDGAVAAPFRTIEATANSRPRRTPRQHRAHQPRRMEMPCRSEGSPNESEGRHTDRTAVPADRRVGLLEQGRSVDRGGRPAASCPARRRRLCSHCPRCVPARSHRQRSRPRSPPCS
jgi:hypothetical protein